MRFTSKILLFIFFILILKVELWAASFTVNFTEISVDNVKPGVPVTLLEKANFLLSVTNTSSEKTEIGFELSTPDQSQLKAGYEPIKNPNWIKMEKNNFILEPNQKEDVDIIIYAPYNKDIFGKKYQAVLKTYTLEGLMKISINNYIFISFTNDQYEKETLNNKLEENKSNNKELEIIPKVLYLEHITLPAKINLTKETKKYLTIINKTEQKKNINFYAVSLENLPNIKEIVNFNMPLLELNPMESKVLEIFLNIPKVNLKKDDRMLILIGAKELRADKEPAGQFGLLSISLK